MAAHYMNDIANFNIRNALKAAHIDEYKIYEPYAQARARVMNSDYLHQPPAESDVTLIEKIEQKFPAIRELTNKHAAWLESQRAKKKKEEDF